MTRPVLFGDTFNPEFEKFDLPKLSNEKSPEEHHFSSTNLPFRTLDYEQIEEIIHEGDIADATCQAGDYFGERALLYNECRAATVIALTNCQLLVLDRADFNRLLGSAKYVLKRKAEHYETIVKDIQNKHM